MPTMRPMRVTRRRLPAPFSLAPMLSTRPQTIAFNEANARLAKALQQLIGAGVLAQTRLVICTKGGYLPFDGAPPRDVRRYVEETFVKPGIAELRRHRRRQPLHDAGVFAEPVGPVAAETCSSIVLTFITFTIRSRSLAQFQRKSFMLDCKAAFERSRKLARMGS